MNHGRKHGRSRVLYDCPVCGGKFRSARGLLDHGCGAVRSLTRGPSGRKSGAKSSTGTGAADGGDGR